VVFASAAFLSARRPGSPDMVADLSSQSCMQKDDIQIYKYTIASSKAAEDGKWADETFACSFRNVTDTHGCADLGKTSCLPHTMAYNLHFVTNHITAAGEKDVAYWDDFMVKEHGKMEKFNAFMDYRMSFYVPDLTDFAVKMYSKADENVLLRSSTDGATSTTWYSALLMSPSGKIFEVMSSRLNLKALSETGKGKKELSANGGAVKSWNDEAGSCAATQNPATDLLYSVSELDDWYVLFNKASEGEGHENFEGMMPVRNNIAVSSLSKTQTFWSSYFPSLKLGHSTANKEDTCKSLSWSVPVYTSSEGFQISTRFVENRESGIKGDHTVADFIKYIDSVHADNASPNKGWDAWYDRHLGLLFNDCSLDTYMTKFFKNDVAFNPHGRDGTTQVTQSPTQHCWTEGVEGYGLEMQGFYDFSFRDCYTIFDWCSADSSGKEFCNSA